MNLIKRWLAPPVFEGDEEKTRQAMLVNMIGLNSLVFLLVILTASFLAGNTPSRILIIELFLGCAVILQFLRWLRSGKVKLARVGMVVFGLVFITGTTAGIGTIRAPAAATFVFWVLMTGLLFELRGIVIGTVAASLAVLGLIVAENAGLLRQPFQGVGVTQWIIFTALFGFTSGLTYYIIQGTKGVLARAQREIEQRKAIETTLKESEQRYRSLVELMPVALVVHRKGKFVYVNPAAVRMFGAASANDLLDTSMLDRVHSDFRQTVLARLRNFADHGLSSPIMVQRLLKLDGTVMDVEVNGMVISYDGEPAFQVSMRDITASKAVEAELEAARSKAENASQAKSRFLASASHDLRQPAHALGMFVARLSQLPHNAQTRHLVGGIDDSVRALQDMLEGLFDISRLDSDQTQIGKAEFPIEAVFGPLRRSLSGAASDKGLRLRFRPSPAWVESDPGLLNRILLNLVSNAIRYTQHGSVLVACRPTNDGSQLRIEVRDSGVGIVPEHHEDVFQEFFQIDNPQRDRSKGLGVGLSIVERACRLMEHPLAMRSAPGRGTCFTVTVPLVQARVGGKYEEPTHLASQDEFVGLRVLLIEDDALGRVGLSSLLASWGCSVKTVEGAQAADELYRQEKAPDMIISDFRLGGGVNGIEAVGMVRGATGQTIAACLISGDTDAKVRDQAQAAGLTLLQKPVRPAKLRSLMRHLVKASSLQ